MANRPRVFINEKLSRPDTSFLEGQGSFSFVKGNSVRGTKGIASVKYQAWFCVLTPCTTVKLGTVHHACHFGSQISHKTYGKCVEPLHRLKCTLHCIAHSQNGQTKVIVVTSFELGSIHFINVYINVNVPYTQGDEAHCTLLHKY